MDVTQNPIYVKHLKRGYLILSWVGLTAWLLGAIFFSPRLRGYWRKLAHGYARARTGLGLPRPVQSLDDNAVPDIAVPVFSGAAEACRQVAIDDKGSVLCVYLYEDRIERLLKTPTKPANWQKSSVPTHWQKSTGSAQAHARTHLAPLTPERMARAGYDFNLVCAIDMTKDQIKSGKTDRMVAKTASVSQVVVDQSAAIREVGQAEVLPQTSGNPKVVKSFIGTVTYAGKDTVRPDGRPAYDTFTVILRNAAGQEEKFSGTDLRDRIKKGEVPLGADLLIEQYRVEIVSDADGGKKRTKNEFRITPQ